MLHIQSILDENKNDLNDGLYLKLSNELMKAFKSETKYYKLTYICVDINFETDNLYNTGFLIKEQFIKATEDEVNTIKSLLDTHKIIRPYTNLNCDTIFKQLLKPPSFSVQNRIACDDCDACKTCESLISSNIAIINLRAES